MTSADRERPDPGSGAEPVAADEADDASRQPVCIFAPAPQLTITIEQTLDERADLHIHPGGQGIWVARMVRTLGLRPVVCSPFGGESGMLARSLAIDEGIDVRGVETNGANGAYIDDRRGGERLVLVEIPAAVLSRHELDDLYARTLEAAVESGVCVVTGTHADRIIPEETFRRLAADLRANDVVVVADLTGTPLEALLDAGIDVLKISHEELADAGLADGGDDSVQAAIATLRRRGARDVVVSRAERSTLAAMGDTLYEVAAPRLEVVEARGSGDSMTAGLAVGAALDLGAVETLQLSAAAGASNVTRHGVATGGREVVDALLERVEVTALSVIGPSPAPVRSGSWRSATSTTSTRSKRSAAAASDKLSTYRAKRDFTATPEPSGERAAGSRHDGRLRFVVQRHRARRLHYDLRLELDGTFVSWAVPKGPTLDPKVKSLAVKVEDHPLDYGWFEGIIPSGYGMGDVVVWDDGWWEIDPEDDRGIDLATAVEDGELKFALHGRKLQGRFLLLRTKDDQWLLFHKKDGDAVPGWQPEEHPRSVLSGRTNEDVRESRPAWWPGPTSDDLAALDALGAKGEWTVDGQTLVLTNLDKVLIPREGRAPGVTKRDIVRYYACIAPWIAPWLAGRPLNLHRFPDGVGSGKGGFWHKALPAHAPEWVRRWPNPLADEGETRDYLLVDGAPALAWAANFAGIELHPWTSTAAAPEEPSYALVDIDPGPETTWDEALTLARLYRTAIDHLGLVARPKVTGQRGIQVWIPVRRGYTFADTRGFVEALSRTVGGVVPDLVSWKWQKDARKGKARLDYTQNMINKTLVAPYSLRPAPGAPVSVPIEWDELDDPALRPDRWTIDDVLDRLEQRGDPFVALLAAAEQELPAL